MSDFHSWTRHQDRLADWPSVVTWLWICAGPSCSWAIWVRGPGPPGWGSLTCDSNVWLWVLSDSNQCVISLQITDPSSCQRGRPTWRRKNSSPQSGSKYASPNISPYLCCCFIKKTFTSCFYKYLYVHIIWISTKPCTIAAEGMEAYINEYAYKYTYSCICDSLIIGKFGSLL
jgi:hypothetical protein